MTKDEEVFIAEYGQTFQEALDEVLAGTRDVRELARSSEFDRWLYAPYWHHTWESLSEINRETRKGKIVDENDMPISKYWGKR